MNPLIRCLSLLVLLTSVLTPPLAAQDPEPETVRIETNDGNILIGTLLRETDQHITLLVDGLGEVNIEKTTVRRMTVLDPRRIRNGEYWFANAQGTRYFFAPNAIGLRRGHGYYQNTWIFFNNVNYGISDHFSIGGGLIPGFLFGGGISATPVWILPKLSFPVNENLNVAVGAMLGGIIATGSGGLLYGSATLGNTDRNLTFGLGYGLADGDLSDTPLVNISGMYRYTRTVYALLEVYFLPGIEGSGFAIYGARWSPENFAVDFGLASPLSPGTGIIGIPWLGVTIPFGR